MVQPAATVLSMTDWKRLNLQISGVNLQQEAAKRRLENKEAKHQTSLSMVKNWTNTIDVSCNTTPALLQILNRAKE